MLAHLHVHTEASLLDGLARLNDIFATAAADGQTALAVTDHGTLGGIWKAKKAAAAAGVKLIPGIELYLAITEDGGFGSRTEPQAMMVGADSDLTDDSDAEDSGPKRKQYYHLTVLASSRAGWHNLVKVVNASEQTRLGKYPLADLELLRQHRDGLIILSGCLGGPVLGPLANGDVPLAQANLDELVSVFGQSNVYVEVMEHGIAQESVVLPELVRMAQRSGLPLVATNDSHYTHAEDEHTHDAWLALRTKASLDDKKRYRFTGSGYHLRTEAEMRAARPEDWWQDAVSNTAVVADRVDEHVVPDGSPRLPTFPTPAGFANNTEYLAHLINAGADRIFAAPRPPEVSERLTSEWQTIFEMGFVDYFLILHDVVSWARANDILVGPGRGSAAGSLIAYVIGLTGVNPLEHDLLFERFLEPGRSDFPDIDIDFESSRRNDILAYLEQRWGEGHVALIGTYGVSKSRASVQAAARLLEKHSVGAALTKFIPIVEGQPMSFAELFDEDNQQTAEFRAEVARQGSVAADIITLAQGFADVATVAGVHACGVVVSDQYLPDIIPLRIHSSGRWVTQWDSRDIESFGLVKFDVLSLMNLDIARKAIEYIAELTNERIDFDTIPAPWQTSDPRVAKAWQLIREGRTSGIFQMEGGPMTRLTQDVQPTSIDDLSAILALFRPGPISAGMPEHYGLRKNGKEPVDYGLYTADPTEQAVLEQVLGKTYGLVVYQESMMRLGGLVAGFDAKQRSKLRKAIGKKNKELMAQVKGEFIAGGTARLSDESGEVVSIPFRADTVERLWSMFEGAASYAFNASHSYAYAYLAYYTAYLKANWPGAFNAAILACADKATKRSAALRSMEDEGITVLPPDVNLSRAETFPEGDTAVRLGLTEIRDVGTAGEWVVHARADAPFRDLADLVHRVRVDDEGLKHMASNQLIGLIESGACDAFGPRLGLSMMARLARAPLPAPTPDFEYGFIERSARQRIRLGTSLGEHPLVMFQQQVVDWRKVVRLSGGEAIEERGIPVGAVPDTPGAIVTVIGLLSSWTEGSYRGGRKAALALEGSRDRIEAIMWDRDLTAQRSLGIPPLGWPVAVTARVTVREFEQMKEDGGIDLVTVKQLTVSRIDRVDIDDPAREVFGLAPAVPNFCAPRELAAVEPAPVALDVEVPDEPVVVEAVRDDAPTDAALVAIEVAGRFPNRRALMAALPADYRDTTLRPNFLTQRRSYELYRGGEVVATLTVSAT